MEILWLAVGLALLCGGAELLVRGTVGIASACGVSPLVIGLTLVAAATSSPELVVSIQAALDNRGEVSVGNVVGSNICNIALILGASALVRPLKVERQLLRFDGPVLLAVSVAFAAIGMLLGGIGRIVGMLFLAALAVYTVRIVAISRREKKLAHAAAEIPVVKGGVAVAIVLSLAGLGGLVLGGKLLVDAAVEIGKFCGLSEAVIGLTIVAAGTSMPEFAASLVAAWRGQSDIAIGNVIGSNIFNILGIMGAAPLLRPVVCPAISPVDWAVMVALTLMLLPLMRSGSVINRAEGGLLLASYAGYTAYLIW
ncbi:MAG: calcium/sodium antiporter [Victivallaceae bacterium]